MTHEQGTAALNSGDFAAAVTFYEAAAEANPDDGEIRHNLAQGLHHVGREGDAIIQATNALARDPDHYPAARLLAALLNQLQLRNPCGIDPRGLTAAFGHTDVDHQNLAPTALAYLKRCTALTDALALAGTRDWEIAADWLLSSKGRPVLTNPLLHAILSAAKNTDLDIELLLTAFRKKLLFAPIKETLRKPHILEFAHVLARQMEINEYVFAVSNEEQDRLERIFVKTKAISDGSRAAAENLLLKALYDPLKSLLDMNGDEIDGATIRPRTIGNFVTSYTDERRAETQAAQGIESLGLISDQVSQDVANQYEESPYPRWLSLHTPVAGARHKQLAHHFPDGELAFMNAPYKVLVAGCGTGRQAIDASLSYGPNAALTAIDISRSSLAYARRMADRFDTGNLRFIQCDILNTGLLEDTFDIIECCGVLHHMNDPWRGWKVLAQNLRPGGLMKIALYSQADRRFIAALREEIKGRGLESDAQTIRTYRQEIIAQGDAGKGAPLRQSPDFFSLSDFRDLMFHVSEQHMTIPQIGKFMAENALTFQGFQLPLDLEEGHPQGDALRDLEQWHRFEEKHPSTFKSMYVFWCRKT